MQGSKWNVNSMIGAGGGLVASVATCPLDVIKTKLQAQTVARGHAGYLGVLPMLKKILRRDGFRGLYRGLGPTILGYLPTWAIYFAVYDGIKTRFGDAPLGSNQRRSIYPAAHPKGYQPTIRDHPWSLHILSAMSAGACSTICTNPLWVIKTRFMTQPASENRYRHTLDAFTTIYRSEGPRAFYRGLVPSLLGIAHVAVQFPLYEQLRAWAQSKSSAPLTTSTILLCSAASKMTASIATYPHEVVRTRLQIQRRFLPGNGVAGVGVGSKDVKRYKGLVHTARRIVHEEGWRGLYKGLSINLFRTVPNSAVTMLTYEMLMRHLSSTDT
ncbi:mitochondrial NAD transporter [Ramaria rubella]|nr:mitochondrial NAD transporter [Ramaria rubella]